MIILKKKCYRKIFHVKQNKTKRKKVDKIYSVRQRHINNREILSWHLILIHAGEPGKAPKDLCREGGTLGIPKNNKEHPSGAIRENGPSIEESECLFRRLDITWPLIETVNSMNAGKSKNGQKEIKRIENKWEIEEYEYKHGNQRI